MFHVLLDRDRFTVLVIPRRRQQTFPLADGGQFGRIVFRNVVFEVFDATVAVVVVEGTEPWTKVDSRGAAIHNAPYPHPALAVARRRHCQRFAFRPDGRWQTAQRWALSTEYRRRVGHRRPVDQLRSSCDLPSCLRAPVSTALLPAARARGLAQAKWALHYCCCYLGVGVLSEHLGRYCTAIGSLGLRD